MNNRIDEMSAGFMLGVVYRKAAGILQQRLRDYDITPEQWSVLYFIVRSEGLIQKQIAACTYKDKPTVTRILHQLENRQLIKRSADLEDRRSIRIYSTEKGKALMNSTVSIEQGITDEMIQCLGEERYALMMESLFMLRDYYVMQSDAED